MNKVRVVLFVVIAVFAGIVPASASQLSELISGKNQRVIVVEGGTVSVQYSIFADGTMTDRLPVIPSPTVVDGQPGVQYNVEKSQCGPILKGKIDIDPGSGNAIRLDIGVDSDTEYFQTVPPPTPMQNQDEWLRSHMCEQRKLPGGAIAWRPFDFVPFVSFKIRHDIRKGAHFFALNLARLSVNDYHVVYVRVITDDQDSRPAPPKAAFRFFLTDGSIPLPSFDDNSGEALSNTPPPAYVAPTSPAASLPTTSTSEFQLLDDAPEVRISDTAELTWVAAQVGYTGPLGRRASFRVNSQSVRARTNVVLFFMNGGNLVSGRKVGIQFGSTQRQAVISDRGYLILKSGGPNELPLNAAVSFFLEGLGRMIDVGVEDSTSGLWLPLDISAGRAN